MLLRRHVGARPVAAVAQSTRFCLCRAARASASVSVSAAEARAIAGTTVSATSVLGKAVLRQGRDPLSDRDARAHFGGVAAAAAAGRRGRRRAFSTSLSPSSGSDITSITTAPTNTTTSSFSPSPEWLRDHRQKQVRRREPFFVTAPIFYANGAPHVGHLYTTLLCDARARFARLHGADTLFSVGSDEHGIKVQQAATAELRARRALAGGGGGSAAGSKDDKHASGTRARDKRDGGDGDGGGDGDDDGDGDGDAAKQLDELLQIRGMDEQATPVATSAAPRGSGDDIFPTTSVGAELVAAPEQCEEFAGKRAAEFRRLFDMANIQYDEFVRTTEARHARVVRALFALLHARGDVYTDVYEGWYAPSDEAFLAEDETELVRGADGESQRVARDSGSPVEWVSEDNFKFRLVRYAPAILEWIEESERASDAGGGSVIEPAKRRDEVKRFLERLLDSPGLGVTRDMDLSVSRPARRIPFGIDVPPVPLRPGEKIEAQTVYVWLDALANYLTVAGLGGAPGSPEEELFEKFWPPDLQIIGKDIVKFHAVYWPGFLLSSFGDAEETGDDEDPTERFDMLPKRIVAHGHWLVGGRKMSKSVGNVVDPVALLERSAAPADFWRYLFLTEARSLGEDSTLPSPEFEEELYAKIRADLVGTMGNLFTRTTRLNLPKLEQAGSAEDFCSWSRVPAASSLVAQASSLYGPVGDAYEQCEFATGAKHVLRLLRSANAFVEKEAPWQSAKIARNSGDASAAIHAAQVCYVAQEVLRLCAIYLLPIMPSSCFSLLKELGMNETQLEAPFRKPIGEQDSPLRFGWRTELLGPSAKDFKPFEIAEELFREEK